MLLTNGRRCGVAAAMLIASLTGCVSTPVVPTPVAPTPAPTPVLTPVPTVEAPAQGAGPPSALERIADAKILHGDAVGAAPLVALPGGGFLMLKSEDVPDGGVLLRSDDGRTWAELDARSSGLDAGAILDLAASDTTAVILGATKPRSGDGNDPVELAEWTSADGVTWTRQPDEGRVLTDFGTRSIVGSPRGFATLGDPPLTVQVAGPDGRHWRSTDLPVPAVAQGSIDQVVPTADGFLAVGSLEDQTAVWRWVGAGWFRTSLLASDSITTIAGAGARIIATGTLETPDPRDPDRLALAAIAFELADGGSTWSPSALKLDGITDIGVFAAGGGFLAVLYPADPQKQLSMWRSVRPGAWESVQLRNMPGGPDQPLMSAVAVSGSRVVMAGDTVGTGGGGDRVVVLVGDVSAP